MFFVLASSVYWEIHGLFFLFPSLSWQHESLGVFGSLCLCGWLVLNTLLVFQNVLKVLRHDVYYLSLGLKVLLLTIKSEVLDKYAWPFSNPYFSFQAVPPTFSFPFKKGILKLKRNERTYIRIFTWQDFPFFSTTNLLTASVVLNLNSTDLLLKTYSVPLI